MSKFAVLRPVTVMMMSLALIVLGFISLSKIKLRLLPALNVPFVSITTKFSGATPFEVEEKVTNPIEQAMSTVPGLYSLQSESRTGISIINLKFKNADNMLKLLSELRDRVNGIFFEKGVGRAKIAQAHGNSSPVFKVAIAPTSDNPSSLIQLANYLKGTLTKKFDDVDNVAIVGILGTPSKQINLRIDPIFLSAYNLSIDKISTIIAKKNKILSAGQIVINESKLGIRVINQLETVEDIMNLFIPITKNKFIQLKEIAVVESILKSPEINTSLNGRNTLIVEVYKSANGNTVQITEELDKIFTDFKQNNPMESTVLLNQGTAIAESIDNVVNAVLNGGILAAVILFLFLGSLTPTLIVSVAIPMSVIITLILMYFTKVTFNLMSLGGLALGIGMLVDNAIVVLENINQMRSKMQDQYQAIIWVLKK
ncbi:MAG: efflux RND transporter permease subunit [Oligoflexales bacterium]